MSDYLPLGCSVDDFDCISPKEEAISRRMEDKREEALNSLSKIVHAPYLESFARLLDYAQNEHEPEALKIVKDLDLRPEDFLALRGDFDSFAEYLQRDDWWDGEDG